ncbi:hypothetical protein LPJ74_004164 [Coemansia sp. RSA 1843]|nr:hypothetical protein LPJ74_004164 [Coemansia sp. RSA 1843]
MSNIPPNTQTDSGGTSARAANKSPQPNVAEEKHHRLKNIQWVDAQTGIEREVRIATQNENGPCPLLALANVLALEGRVTLASASRPSVSDDDLVAVLANHLVSTDREEDMETALSLLPSLRTGLDVDLQFASIHGFADAPPLRLFRAFDVDVVHGWVVDSERESVVAQALEECANGYEGAVEFVLQADDKDDDKDRALAVREWLARTASQLTDNGLRLLGTQLPDCHVCVMFRNNHFSVLYKRRTGELFLLCTDDGVAGDDRIVWESLRDVRQTSSEFLDARFAPIVLRAASEANDRAHAGYSADYVRQMSAPLPGQQQQQQQGGSSQVDSDFALALLLQQQEEAASQKAAQARGAGAGGGGRALQLRQENRLPPGMRQNSNLYGVPQVDKPSALARAARRSKSDDNFGQQMADALLPHEASSSPATSTKAVLPKSPSKSKSIEDRCVVM